MLKYWSSLSKVKKQVVLSYGVKGASVLVSLAYIPLALGYLSPQKFGIWIALTSVINWMKLFDVGIGNGLRHQLATALALDKFEKANELVSTTYFFMSAIFGAALLVFFFVNPFINWQEVLNTNEVANADLVYVAAVGVTAVVLTFVLQLIKMIYAAHGDTATGNSIQLAGSALALLGLWVVSMVAEPGNLLLAVVVIAGSPLLAYMVVSIWTFTSHFPELRPKWSKVKFRGNRALFSLSGKFFVVQITATILYASLPFIITQFYGPEAVSEFHVARSIFNLPTMAIGLFVAPLVPMVTQAFAKQNYQWIRRMLNRSLLLAGAIVVGTVVLILIAPWVYEVWLGDKIEVPYSLSVWVGIYTIVSVLVHPFSAFINGLGKINILVWLAPVGIAMFIGGCFVFDSIVGSIEAIIMALALSSVVGLFAEPPVIYKSLKVSNSNLK